MTEFDPSDLDEILGKPKPGSAGKPKKTLNELIASAKKANSEATVAAGAETDLKGAGNGFLGTALKVTTDTLGSPLAALASAATPDEYLVGEGGGEIKKASDRSLFEDTFGDNPLGGSDLIGGLLMRAGALSTKDQREFFASEGSDATSNPFAKGSKSSGLWAAHILGVVPTVVLDPLNAVGGVGLADDAVEGLSAGAKAAGLAARLSERAAVDGADSFASRALKLVEDYHGGLDAAAGLADDAERAAKEGEHLTAFKDAYGLLSGEALANGDTAFEKLRWEQVGRKVREAPTAMKERGSTALDRVNRMVADVARFTDSGLSGIGGSTSAAVSAGRNPQAWLGGRRASDVVQAVLTRGFAGLDADTAEMLGVTGRLAKNPLLPFSAKGAAVGTLAEDGSLASKVSPFAWVRETAFGANKVGQTTAGRAVSAILQPSLGRQGKMWKAAATAAAALDGGDASAEIAAQRVAKLVGKKSTDLQVQDWVNYPLSLMDAARVEGLVRNGGRALQTQAGRVERVVSSVINRDTTESAEGGGWKLLGGDVTPRVDWSASRQKAFEAADSSGSIRTAIGGALRDSLQRLDISDDLSDEFLAGVLDPAERTVRLAKLVISDPQFGEDITRIGLQHAGELAAGGTKLGTEDLLRVVVNGIGQLATVSKETNGLLSWREELTREAAGRVFSTSGAAEIGSDARLVTYLERLGMALADVPVEERSTQALRTLAEETADVSRGHIEASSAAAQRFMQTTDDVENTLRRLGVAESKISDARASLLVGMSDQDSLVATLAKLSEDLDLAKLAKVESIEALDATAKNRRDLAKSLSSLAEVGAQLSGLSTERTRVASMIDDMSALDRLISETMASQPASVLEERLSALLDETGSFGDLTQVKRAEVRYGKPGVGRQQAGNVQRWFARSEAKRWGQREFKQVWNSALSDLRDIFGESIDLGVLREHSAATAGFTKGFNMTKGALNDATIAGFFADNAPRRVSEVAEQFGGWEALLLKGSTPDRLTEVTDLGRELIDRFGSPWDAVIETGRKLQQKDKALTILGLDRKAVTTFALNTVGEFVDALAAPLDEIVDFAAHGTASDELARMFAGSAGPARLRELVNFEMGWLVQAGDQIAHQLDLAVGSGGHLNPEGFAIAREIVASDDHLKGILTRLRDQMRLIGEGGAVVRHRLELESAWEEASSMLDGIHGVKSLTDEIAKKKVRQEGLGAQALDALASASYGNFDEATRLSASEAVSAAMSKAKAVSASLRSVEISNGRLTASMADLLERSDVLGVQLEQMTAALGANRLDLFAQAKVMADDMSALASAGEPTRRIFAQNKSMRRMMAGLNDFLADPKVAFKEVDGEMVPRSTAEMTRLWETETKKATDYLDRVVANLDKIDRYKVADWKRETWLEDAVLRGFADVWRGIAVVGGGTGADASGQAGRALIATALYKPQVNPGTVSGVIDTVSAMLKAGYVGRASFSPRNLQSGLIENLTQGTRPAVSRQVFGADRLARELERVQHWGTAHLTGEELASHMGMLAKAERDARAHFGPKVWDAIAESREYGVAEYSLFTEMSGLGLTEARTPGLKGIVGRGKRAVIEQAKVGKYAAEARHGRGGVLPSLAGAAGGVSSLSTLPAAAWERSMSHAVESVVGAGGWGKFMDADAVAMLTSKEIRQSSKQFAASPGVESILRTDLFVQRRLLGDSAESAFDRVMSAHFDYGDLSETDRAIKKVLPFWLWRSRSTVHQAEMVLHHPALAKMTIGPWAEEHQTNADDAPLYAQEPGGGYASTGLGGSFSAVGLNIPVPSSDLSSLLEQLGNGGVGKVFGETYSEDSLALLRLPGALVSGENAKGIPIDTKSSVSNQLEALASSGESGRAFVERIATMRDGKWYWRHPAAAEALGEMMPILSNVTTVLRPMEDGDGAAEKVLGTLTRFFGAPIRPVTQAERERAQTSRDLLLKLELEAQAKKERG